VGEALAAATGGDSNAAAGGPEPTIVASVSLSAAIQSQQAEDRRLAAARFEDVCPSVNNNSKT
jgi:hypothetical protein